MKLLILVVLAALLVGGIVYGTYRDGLQTQVQTYTDKKVTQSPSSSTSPQGALVGNDKDEHGCIPSAGYSWCESKQKCYRPFEESCPSEEDTVLIRKALFTKNNWKESDDLTVSVKTNDGTYASGSVNGSGGGGLFFAAKVNSSWKIVYDGNGIILCSALAEYPDFPPTLIPECFNDSTQKIMKR